MGAVTALTVASIGTSLAGSGMSFAQASQANKAALAARADAEKFVSEARQRLSRNAYAALSLPMQQYEMQREELARAVGQMGEVARTAERGAPETATASIMAANQGARQIGAVAEQAMAGIEEKKAAEQSRLDTAVANIATEQAAGAAKAYRDAMQNRAAAITQGFQQIGSALTSAMPLAQDFDASRSVINTAAQAAASAAPTLLSQIPSYAPSMQIDRFALAATQSPMTAAQNLAYGTKPLPTLAPSPTLAPLNIPQYQTAPPSIPGMVYIPGVGYR